MRTVTIPDVHFVHRANSGVTQQALSLQGNGVGLLQSTVFDLRVMLGHFFWVLGGILLVASVFQFFRHRENPSATLFTQVSTTFFCGVILVGVSCLAAVV